MSLFHKQGSSSDEVNGKSTLSLRINVFFFSTFAIFCVIIIRLAVLQFVEGPTLTELETNRDTKPVPLAAMRGSIFAAEGEKIAYSTPVQSLYITLTKEYTEKKKDKTTSVTDYTPEAKAKVDKLAVDLVDKFNQFGDASEQKLTVAGVKDLFDLEFRKYNGYTPRRIKMGLSTKEVAYFMEHKDEYPGLEVVEENARHYDKDTVAVQTVGYVKLFKNSNSLAIYQDILNTMKKEQTPGLTYKDDESVGFDGLELQYQRKLRGQNGYQEVSINPQNMADKIEKVVPPVKGNDLWMAMNKNVQIKTQQAITDQIKWLHTHPVQGKTHPDAKTGYAVAMEVDTGNVVAMASMPDYDTNAWASGSMDIEIYNQIKDYYQNGAITPIMAGRSGHGFESTVFLGSTVKPLSVLIGLNEGLFTTNKRYVDRGITSFGKAGYETKVRNASGHVLGGMYPHEAIEYSSNVFMVDMVGKKLYEKHGSKGVDVWDKYMKEFGLGVSTGVDLPNEHKGKINYRKEAETGSVQSALVYASFGQQGAYTTLQLAQYASTLANKGKRIKPHLVSKITDPDGHVVKTFGREVLNTVKLDDSYWNEVIRGMKSDVDAFSGFPYDFARKTGTSQQTDNKNVDRDNGVFIAYAPRNKPKLAVAVVIPEGGFGSNSAAPVARKIFDAYDWEYGLDGVPKKTLHQNQSADKNGSTGESNTAERGTN